MKFLESVALGIVLMAGNVSADTLIHAGRLIDGESDSAVTEMTVRVDGSQIEAIAGSDPLGVTLYFRPS